MELNVTGAEGFTTDATLVGLLTGVAAFVLSKVMEATEGFAAGSTSVRFLSSVISFMHLET